MVGNFYFRGIKIFFSMLLLNMVCYSLLVLDEFVPPEPETIEEDEAEQELQKQLEKQRKLKQKQLMKDSGEKVNICLSFIMNCVKSGLS